MHLITRTRIFKLLCAVLCMAIWLLMCAIIDSYMPPLDTNFAVSFTVVAGIVGYIAGITYIEAGKL